MNKYILDTNIVYNLAGINDNVDGNTEIPFSVRFKFLTRKSNLYISEWSLVELFTHNFTLSQRNVVLKYIKRKKIKIIRIKTVEQLSKDLDSFYLQNEIKIRSRKNYYRLISFKKTEKFDVTNLLNAKITAEANIFKFYLTIINYYTLSLFDQKLKSKKRNGISKYVHEASILCDKVFKRFSSNPDFDRSSILSIISNYYHGSLQDPNKETSIELTKFIYSEMKEISVIYDLIAIKIHSLNPDDFKSTYTTYFQNALTKLSSNQQVTGIVKSVYENAKFDKCNKELEQEFSSDYPIGVIKSFESRIYDLFYNSQFEFKNDMIDSHILENYPEYYVLTYDRNLQNNIKSFSPEHYSKLKDFLKI